MTASRPGIYFYLSLLAGNMRPWYPILNVTILHTHAREPLPEAMQIPDEKARFGESHRHAFTSCSIVLGFQFCIKRNISTINFVVAINNAVKGG